VPLSIVANLKAGTLGSLLSLGVRPLAPWDNSRASDQGLSIAGATPLLWAVLVGRKPLTLRLGPSWVFSIHARESNMANPPMAKSDQPFAGFSDMMTQNFEQTRKAIMEQCAGLFGNGIKAFPWLDADLNKKMQSYTEKNMAAANEFMRKLSEAKDVQSFWQIQTDFMQMQWKTFGEQMKDFGETATKSMTGGFKNIGA
jgi:hypothetical protein